MSNAGSVKAPSSAFAVKNAGMSAFATYLREHEKAISSIGASFMNPTRVTRIVLGCVAQTPALKECTMASILSSVMKAVELGLEPGSAIGEAHLVPFKSTCQMIPGYRGLISLATRSGKIASIQAHVVFEGDEFEFEYGLTPKLRHIPSGDTDNPEKITHAYCVVAIKDADPIFDVMTRKEIDRIRGKSKASQNGPWVTDYAEMAKKTVTRRALKYCPMSIEMSKAMAADNAADTGASSDAEFESIDILDGEFTAEEDSTQEAPRTTGVGAVKEKLGLNHDAPKAEEPPAEPQAVENVPVDPAEEIRVGLLTKAGNLLNAMYKAEALRDTVIKKYLNDTPFDQASVDQLNVMIDGLKVELEKKGQKK